MTNSSPHPMVDALIQSLRPGADEPLVLPAHVLEVFRDGAIELDDGAELMAVIDSALRLAHVLGEECGAPQAARALLQSIAPLVAVLQQLAVEDAGQVGRRVEAARAQLGKQESKGVAPAATTGLAPPAPAGVGSRNESKGS